MENQFELMNALINAITDAVTTYAGEVEMRPSTFPEVGPAGRSSPWRNLSARVKMELSSPTTMPSMNWPTSL